jgi:ribosomal-protein-alanine N-acetyltransferase
MNNMLFQSANLDIRRFNLNDDAFILELLNTPAWKQFIGDRNINTREDAVSYILNGPLASYDNYGYGAWLVILKDIQQPIGMCGLFKRDYLDKPDLGFAFYPGLKARAWPMKPALHHWHTYGKVMIWMVYMPPQQLITYVRSVY